MPARAGPVTAPPASPARRTLQKVPQKRCAAAGSPQTAPRHPRSADRGFDSLPRGRPMGNARSRAAEIPLPGGEDAREREPVRVSGRIAPGCLEEAALCAAAGFSCSLSR